jgi:hypothetical protein
MRRECRVALVHGHIEDTIELRHAVSVSPELGSGVFSVCQPTPGCTDLVARFERALFAASLPSRVVPTCGLSAEVFGVVLALQAIPKLSFRLLMRNHGVAMLFCFAMLFTRFVRVPVRVDADRWSRANA